MSEFEGREHKPNQPSPDRRAADRCYSSLLAWTRWGMMSDEKYDDPSEEPKTELNHILGCRTCQQCLHPITASLLMNDEASHEARLKAIRRRLAKAWGRDPETLPELSSPPFRPKTAEEIVARELYGGPKTYFQDSGPDLLIDGPDLFDDKKTKSN